MSTAPKNAITQFLSNVASGKAALVTAQAELATAAARITELEASQVTLTAERDTAKTALTALEVSHAEEKAAHTKTLAAHEALCGTLGFKPAEIAGKTDTELQAAFNAKVSTLATEQLAALGFDPTKLPAPSASEGQHAKQLTYAEFSALTPAGKMDFSVKGGRIVG